MKRKLILFIIAFLLILPANAYAYWLGIGSPDESDATGAVTIGRWYFHDPDDPDAPPVIIFDPDNPVDIAEGSIVVVNVDGNTYIYQSLQDIDADDPHYDPTQPNPNWNQPMLYSEDTKEYRDFHRYLRSDYVIQNGKTYRWNYGVPHNPNTITQVEPGTNENRWRTVSDTPREDLWFRTKIYYEGDEVNYEPVNALGNLQNTAGRYRCISGGHSGASQFGGSAGIEPGIDPSVWEYIGPLP